MSSNDAARQFLDHFLDQPGDPEFAVMLEGPWGSGKTYFVRNYFEDRITRARRSDPDTKGEIRISLFGVRDLSEVTSQIFAQVHPWLGGKAAKIVNIVASRAASGFGVSLDEKKNESMLQDMLLNLEGRVLVFDDFERCPLDVIEVMGFINRFVEQDRLKVLVVASEADIDPEQASEYRSRKEKLIGKTVRVGSEPAEVLDHFTKALGSAEAKVAIEANREAVLQTFGAAGSPNYRSLRAVLGDFDRLVSVTDSRLRENPNALRRLLLFMIATGFEWRLNRLDSQRLPQLLHDMERAVNKAEPDRLQARAIRDRYPLVTWRDPIVPPDQLARLFASGAINVPVLNAFLEQHPLVAGNAHVPNWRLMWSWHHLTPAEYRTVRDKLLQQLKNREVTHPGEILHIAGTAIQLKTYGDDLLGRKGPESYFRSYLSDLAKTDTLLAAPELFEVPAPSHASLGYQEEDTKEFRTVFDLVRNATSGALARRMTREAPALLKRLRAAPGNGRMLFEWGLEGANYGGVAILHNIHVNEMADLLLPEGRTNDGLMACLTARYEHAPTMGSLDPEQPWLRKLRTELRRRARKSPPPFGQFSEQRLEGWFAKLNAWIDSKPKKGPQVNARITI